MESAKRNMALMPGLGGTCVAIFNFSLFFLYPRFVSGEASQIFFRLAVGDIVVSLFFFMYAATFYYLFVEGFPKDAKRAIVYFAWADRCAVVAIALFTISPALVLFAVDLPDLGLVALGLWLLHIGILFVTSRGTRS
jgi:hypothetical protein